MNDHDAPETVEAHDEGSCETIDDRLEAVRNGADDGQIMASCGNPAGLTTNHNENPAGLTILNQ